MFDPLEYPQPGNAADFLGGLIWAIPVWGGAAALIGRLWGAALGATWLWMVGACIGTLLSVLLAFMATAGTRNRGERRMRAAALQSYFLLPLYLVAAALGGAGYGLSLLV